MTCIVALVEKGDMWMGADSAITGGSNLRINKAPKIHSRKHKGTEYLIGGSGYSRINQILHYELELPENPAPKEEKALFVFIVKEFVPLIKKALSAHGNLMVKDNIEQIDEGRILMIVNGHIFSIDSRFHVVESDQNFEAIGSGGAEAYGALYATKGMEPKARLQLALKAAESATSDVRGPFTFIKTKS
jgi:ATP-dependent protease HslVU (ClpYQ) peptidase subunit